MWRSDNPCAPGAATHQGMVYAIQNPFTGKYLYPTNGACWRYHQDDMLKIMREWADYELIDYMMKRNVLVFVASVRRT